MNFWDNGSGVSQAYVDKNGNALSQANTQIPAGVHSITAGYYGDNSFSSSANLAPISFTIGRLNTNTNLASQQTATQLLLTAKVSASSTGTPPTGTITFTSGSTVLGTSSLTNGSTANGTSQATATFDGSQLAPGQYSLTASYPGDTNYGASTSSPVSLNLVADFSVANRGIATQTATAGQVASYVNDIGVTPFFGFSATVNLTCSASAAATSCSVSPASFPGASGIASVAVTTMARSAGMPARPGNPPRFVPVTVTVLVGLCICVMLVLLSRAPRRRLVGRLGLLLLLLALEIGMASCGGGGGTGYGGGLPPPQSGTPAGTYTVTVTATSGTTTHSMTLTLIVQ